MKYTFSHHTLLSPPADRLSVRLSVRQTRTVALLWHFALCCPLSALLVILFSSEVHLRIPSNCKAKCEQRKMKTKNKNKNNKKATKTMEPSEAAATKSN